MTAAHEANGADGDPAARLAAAEARLDWLEAQVARLALHYDAARPQPAPPAMTSLPRSASVVPAPRAGQVRRL